MDHDDAGADPDALSTATGPGDTRSDRDDPDRPRAIRAERFGLRYPTGDGAALEGLSFEVAEGDVLGVLGPTEAGKTTLAMALSGFAPRRTGGVADGDLVVAGRDPREVDDDAVAMVFEDYAAQLTQVRVREEVVAPLVNRGLDRSVATARAGELLELVGLADAAGRFTWELSGGQQQRLAVAAALAVDPDVMVFDGATDPLDPQARGTVAEVVDSLAGSATPVVTTTDPGELVGLADSVLVLDGGRQVAFGPADEVLRGRETLESAGVGVPLCLEVAARVGLDGQPITRQELTAQVDRRLDRRRSAAASPAADGGRTPPEGRREADLDDCGDDVDDRLEGEVGDRSTDGPEATESAVESSAPGTPVVAVDGATYEYGDGTVAVDDIDLSVPRGEVHAVVGGNGAGKSTLCRLLVGLLTPDAGSVRVADTDTRDASVRDLATSIGIAVQNPGEQLSERTVEAELRFPLERRQYERSWPLSPFRTRQYGDDYVEDRVEAVCDLVGIGDDLREEDPMFLPRGTRRLVTIALALATDPDAVVLDEPTAGLDARTRATVREAVERLRAAGTAVVLVDHDVEFVCSVADRVSVLSAGAVVGRGPTRAVFAPDRREWLADHGLRPPRAARLARTLGVEGFTVEELTDRLAARLEGR